MGARHRSRHLRLPHAHDHRVAELMRYFTAAVFVALAALSLHASTPKFFQSSTQTDFLKGDVENLSIDSHGQLTLGPATELVYETASPFLWTLVPGADGVLFAGA